MQNLSLAELVRVTDDLLTRRAAPLALTAMGPFYRTMFERTLAEYNALPPALRGVPMADILAEADARHDAALRALFLMRDLCRTVHAPTPAMLAAATALDRELGDMPRATTSPYMVQAQRAAERAPRLAAHADTFAAVPTPDGRTLRDWTNDYVAAAQELDTLLSDRSLELHGATGRAVVGTMRGRLMGALGELRAAVRRELEFGQALPADIDVQLFSYLDEAVRLSNARTNTTPGGANPSAGTPAAPAEPAAG